MSDNTHGFKVSYLLGIIHVRLAMALEHECPSDTLDDLIKLKADLDRDIGRLYYPSPEL